MTSTKAIVQAVGAVLVAVLPLLVVGPLGFSEIVNIIVVAVGTYQVWNAKNYPNWRYAKLYASVATTLTAGLVALASEYAFGDVSYQQWIQLGIAIATTILVGYLPNSGSTTRDATDGSGQRVL